jgi:hypothetical protein
MSLSLFALRFWLLCDWPQVSAVESVTHTMWDCKMSASAWLEAGEETDWAEAQAQGI